MVMRERTFNTMVQFQTQHGVPVNTHSLQFALCFERHVTSHRCTVH